MPPTGDSWPDVGVGSSRTLRRLPGGGNALAVFSEERYRRLLPLAGTLGALAGHVLPPDLPANRGSSIYQIVNLPKALTLLIQKNG